MSAFDRHGPPPVDLDEAKLRQLDSLIAQAKEADRKEAARKAEEERQRAEREAAGPGYTLEDLEQRRAVLAAEIAVKQTHIRTEAEQELLRRRADRLRGDLADLEAKAVAVREELAGIDGRQRTSAARPGA